MAKIISGAPRMVCPSCKCTFEYDASDVQIDSEQYWEGFWEGGWNTRRVRRVTCPGCARKIRL